MLPIRIVERRVGLFFVAAAISLVPIQFAFAQGRASGPSANQIAPPTEPAAPSPRTGPRGGKRQPPGRRPAPAGPTVPGPAIARPEPLPPQPALPSVPPPAPAQMLAYSSPILRLASVPNMLGDLFGQGPQLGATAAGIPSIMDLPLAGGSRRVKVAENNKALTMDRVYFMYDHFHNALTADPNPTIPGLARDASVNRYTIGFEKTVFSDCWSVEVRMPFTEAYDFGVPKFDIHGGRVGNLAIVLKRLLAVTDTASLVAGLGIDTPTGSNVTGRFVTTQYVLHNDAVHLSPYVGFMGAPNDRFFQHAFLQVDVAANGNRIDFDDTFLNTSGRLGKLNEQTLLYLDYSAGYWFYRNPCACCVTGLASLVEFHYTTTLQDADTVGGTFGVTNLQFGNLLGRVDFVNLTVGLHAELNNRTNVRVAGVFPLENEPDMPFDAEVHVSVNRRF